MAWPPLETGGAGADRTLSVRRVVLVSVAGLGGVVGLGLVDRATPHVVSLAVLYVIVVLAVTMLAGLVPGLLIAAASAVAWSIGEASAGDLEDVDVSLLNTGLRFLALAIVAVLVHRLAGAVAESRRSAERSREFLAIAAHQLRTPIASVRASAEALLGTEATPVQEQLIATLSAESARAGRLIASLLRVARLDQGELVRREPVDLCELVDAEAERARRRSAVAVRVRGPVRPVPVDGDADAIREVLANLLDNARRHACEHIDVAAHVEDRWATVVVRDDGPGLPAGSEERAFDRFVSLDGRGGAGLGLPIARRLMELMDGDLRYRQGSFEMSLPLAPGPTRATRAGQSAGDDAAPARGGPRE